MSKRRLHEVLRSGSFPGEDDARDRVWNVVRAAHAEREPVSWPRKHARTLVLAAAAAAVVAAALTPPGMAVLTSIRKAVGTERIKHAAPALDKLPGGGALLTNSSSGTWVTYPGGARRHFGPYGSAGFSPSAIYIVGARGHDLTAFEPTPAHDVHWIASRSAPVHDPVWAPDGYRIAYFAGRSLRVVFGDNSSDTRVAAVAAPVKPAWQPLPIQEPKGSRHVLAFVGPAGRILAADTDTRERLWTAAAPDGVRALKWSDDGRRLLVVGRRSLRVLDPHGRLVALYAAKGATLAGAFMPKSHVIAFVVESAANGGQSVVLRAQADRIAPVQLFGGAGQISDLAWSPNGDWLLIAWKSADQWIFIPSGRVGKLFTVLNVSRQFPGGGLQTFPKLEGWCCAK